MNFSRGLVVLVACAASLAMGCRNKEELVGSRVPLTGAEVTPPTQGAAVAAAPAPGGEQVIDTSTPPPDVPTPILTPPASKTSTVRTVRTVPDERLPKWVPKRGRLTVVDSSDLAENLGLVPQGTTKKSDERISVAEKLSEENAARVSANAKTDSMQRGVSWNFAGPGRVRSRR